MTVFYQPNFATEPFLGEEESRHAVKVLRMGVGERVRVVDGVGTWYEAELVKADPKRCAVRIINQWRDEPRTFGVHLALAPTKNADRVEWMLEKCVEIGLDEISFLETRYSERRILKLERLQQVAISAMKQSQKAWLPRLNPLQKVGNFLEKFPTLREETQGFIAHLEEGERKLLHQVVLPDRRICVLVGPEGDFSPDEIQKARQAGFAPVSLGASRLRTETAGLVAVHTINLINQR